MVVKKLLQTILSKTWLSYRHYAVSFTGPLRNIIYMIIVNSRNYFSKQIWYAKKTRNSELASMIIVTAFIPLNDWSLVVVITKLCVFPVGEQIWNIK